MIRLAIERRVATAVLALGLALFGALNIRQLPVDFLPSIKYPLIKLSIAWPGANPDDIERNLAEPIERQLASADGLDYLSSSSLEGLYQLDINFRYGVDVDVAYQDALAAFERAKRDLPDDTEPAVIIKADPAQLPVVQIAFEADGMNLTELRTWIDTWLTDRLLAARGVAALDIAGGLLREVRVLLDDTKLEKYGLSSAIIERRLQEENVDSIGGRVTGPLQDTIVRTLGEFQDIETIRDIVILRTDAGTLRLRDVARVEDSHEDVRLLTRLNGRPAVKVNVIKQADANTVRTVTAVREQLAVLSSSMPPGIRYALLQNQAEHILDAVSGVRNSAIEAGLLVVATFFLFLGSPRQVLIVTSLLPLCALGNFFVMRLAGFSLNIFSLGGLVVSIAIMLDAATVVIENITRLRLQNPDAEPGDNALAGVTEVRSAIVASAVAFFALFSPFFLVPGMITLLFGELVSVILSITLISLLGAVFWVPMLSARFLGRVGKAGQQRGWNRRFNDGLLASYERAIDTALRHRLITLMGFCVALVLGLTLFMRSGAEFFPSVDDGRITVKVRMSAGVSLQRMDAAVQQIEALVQDDPRVASVFAMSGGAVRGLYTNRIGNEGEVNIELLPVARRSISTRDFLYELRPKVAQLAIPGARIMAAQEAMRGIRRLGRSDLELEINGADIDTLFETAQRTATALRERKELTNIDISLDFTKPEWQVTVDRTRAAELGLSVSDVANALQGFIGGHVPTLFRDGSDLFDLRVLIPERSLNTRNDVENLVLARPDGGHVRLNEVASIARAQGPVEITRENQVKQVIVRADVARGSNLGAAERVVRDILAAQSRPDGYTFSLSGKAQQMAEMQDVVRQLLLYAVFFSFIVLAVQFNNLRLPLVIYLAAPFALAGIGFGLFVSDLPFSATVIIAVMIVLAANVNDGVLLIDTAEQMRRQGHSLDNATRLAALQRMRPRLMTTLPIILGFTPLAFALEAGGELLRPMAAAAIGGLSLEVLAALFLVPILYRALAKKNAGDEDERHRLS